MRRRRSQSRTESTVAAKYTALHEGRSPDRFVKEPPVRQPKYYVTLGPVPELIYWKKTPDGDHPYRHQFADWAQPVLATDDRGKLHLVEQQNLTVTERGIEDDMAKRRHRRTALRANPGMSYDDNPRRGRRRGLRLRSNPLGLAEFKRVGMNSVVVGAVGAATGIGLNALFARYFTTYSPYLRAFFKALAGVAGAIGFEAVSLPVVAAGVGVGGVIAGVDEAYNYFQATRVAAAPVVAAPATAAAAGMQYPYYGGALPFPAGAPAYPYQQQQAYCYAPAATG